LNHDHELLILLPPPFESWDYGPVLLKNRKGGRGGREGRREGRREEGRKEGRKEGSKQASKQASKLASKQALAALEFII